jgi:hypothetical protein
MVVPGTNCSQKILKKKPNSLGFVPWCENKRKKFKKRLFWRFIPVLNPLFRAEKISKFFWLQ